MKICSFEEADEPDVIRLWGRCDLSRPSNDPHQHIVRKLAVRRGLFRIAVTANSGEIIGSVMIGYEVEEIVGMGRRLIED